MKLLLASAALAAAAFAPLAHAQMPTDDAAWKQRCDTLHNAVTPKNGASPVWLRTAPGTVAGPQWTEFGWDRDRAHQPAVACVFFYLGAIANHNAPSSHATRVHAKESGTLGLMSWQTLHNQPSTTAQGLTRAHAMLAEIPKGPLTAEGEEAMLAASRTLPLTPPVNTASR